MSEDARPAGGANGAGVPLLVVLTLVAAGIRLLSVFWLHPLNWDEVEYFRATDWVRQGLVPYRDFWEHHTPLQWFVFAPFTSLTTSPGADAIILMRLFQVPVWIVTFALMNSWMREAGLTAYARWAAITLAVCSSLFMIPAVEYRVDALACALFVAALVLLQRQRPVWGGVALCLCGLANLRLGPLLALTALLYAVINTRERRWQVSRRGFLLGAGVVASLAVALLYFAGTDSLRPLFQHVWTENYLGDKYAERVPLSFVHRFLVPFGVRIYGGGDGFELAGVDLAGVAILVLGLIGVVRALRSWREPGDLFFLACLQAGSILFIAAMKFVYHYHLEIVVVIMLPFIAMSVVRRFTTPALAIFTLIAVVVVVFRGKERDFAYQDLIMREAHATTPEGSKVFDGVGWALRREPAYRFWFLPELVRQLVRRGHTEPYTVRDWLVAPPAAVITDRNAIVWLAQNPDLARYVTHHYLPLWRNLWLPGLSARLGSGESIEWIVTAGGRYRVMASRAFASHPWFERPLAHHRGGPGHLRAVPRRDATILFLVNGEPVDLTTGVVSLRRGDRLFAVSRDPQPVGIFAVPGDERTWFREPPTGVTIDSEAPRETHVPLFGAALDFTSPIPTSSAPP